ncbi:hypothetical protein LguiA_017873 [Lonicera macranthoides]
MLGFEYSDNFDKMIDNGGRGGGVEHCVYLREMPNLVDEEESPPELLFDDRKIVIGREEDDDDDMDRCSSSSNSSSIGNNSDEEQHQNSDDKEEEEEVQSSPSNYNNNNGGDCGGGGGGNNFDDAIQALENALPISKRGISRFYNGKSKSFTSLMEAASASGSVKEIAKPENAYSKRQRNLLAHNLTYGDNKKNNKIYSSFHQLHQLGHTRGSRGGGISKRTTNSCKTTTTLALAVAMSTTTNFNDRSSPCSSPRQTTSHSNGGGGGPLLSASSSLLSPRARRNFSALRSFSFADLQHSTTSLTAPPPR